MRLNGIIGCIVAAGAAIVLAVAPARCVAQGPPASEAADLGLRQAGGGSILGTLRFSQKRPLTAVAFSRDGRFIATGGEENRICVWDSRTGVVVKVLRHPGAASPADDLIRALHFSPDSGLLLSSSGSTLIAIWNLTNFQLSRVLNQQRRFEDDLCTDCEFSPDGRVVASAGRGRTISLWDVDTGKLRRSYEVAVDEVNDIEFSPDGNTIALADRKGVGLVEAAQGHAIRRFPEKPIAFKRVAFSPDGTLLASSGAQGETRIWEASTGKEVRRLSHPFALRDALSRAEGQVLFSPDGKTLASAGYVTFGVHLWDVGTGRLNHDLPTGGRIFGVALSPDGKTLAAVGDGNHVRFWGVGDGRELRPFGGHAAPVRSVAFSPDGASLASAGLDRTLRVWSAATGKEILTVDDPDVVLHSAVAFTPDGKSLVSAGEFDGNISIWDRQTGKRVRNFFLTKGVGIVPDLEVEVRCLAVSSDGRLLVTGHGDGRLVSWDIARGEKLLTLRHPVEEGGDINAVAISPDNKMLVSGCVDGTIRSWDLPSGRPLQGCKLDGQILSLALSADGKILASCAGTPDRGKVRLWEFPSCKPLRTLEGHRDTVLSVAFSGDGKFLASGAADGSIGLWEPSTGRRLRELSRGDAIISLAFSPDGRSLAAAGDDDLIVVYKINE